MKQRGKRKGRGRRRRGHWKQSSPSPEPHFFQQGSTSQRFHNLLPTVAMRTSVHIPEPERNNSYLYLNIAKESIKGVVPSITDPSLPLLQSPLQGILTGCQFCVKFSERQAPRSGWHQDFSLFLPQHEAPWGTFLYSL